jgi:hypothetical protein
MPRRLVINVPRSWTRKRNRRELTARLAEFDDRLVMVGRQMANDSDVATERNGREDGTNQHG